MINKVVHSVDKLEPNSVITILSCLDFHVYFKRSTDLRAFLGFIESFLLECNLKDDSKMPEEFFQKKFKIHSNHKRVKPYGFLIYSIPGLGDNIQKKRYH